LLLLEPLFLSVFLELVESLLFDGILVLSLFLFSLLALQIFIVSLEIFVSLGQLFSCFRLPLPPL